jgi:hypothetical protein
MPFIKMKKNKKIKKNEAITRDVTKNTPLDFPDFPSGIYIFLTNTNNRTKRY